MSSRYARGKVVCSSATDTPRPRATSVASLDYSRPGYCARWLMTMEAWRAYRISSRSARSTGLFLHPSPILSRTSRAIAGGKSQPNDCASAAECDSGRPDSKVDATPVSRRKVGERVGARLRICRARPESAQALVRHICCAGKPDIARLPSRSEHGGQSVDVGLLSSAPRASSTHEHAGSGVSSCKTSCLLCVDVAPRTLFPSTLLDSLARPSQHHEM
mmetsp:Transcript_19835/g.54419  ORF Transcript_19835/g.54419 Transcript_19835/m.54419 type:complete len:218 (-) Transcript_19835:22-675(-)